MTARARRTRAAAPAAPKRNHAESPLAWLFRRGLIGETQFAAGERLRADFERAQLMPRLVSSWESPVSDAARGPAPAEALRDGALAARARLREATDLLGPDLAHLAREVCCFLTGLETVEKARGWPARSGKVVRQIALDRLADHYGFAPRPGRPPMQSWRDPSMDEA